MKEYRKVVRLLKQKFPLEFPVNVRRLQLSKLDGDCQLKNNSFLIRIDRDLEEHEAIEVVIHEYAHAIAWDRCHNDLHCDEWGKAYSRVYRCFLKEFFK